MTTTKINKLFKMCAKNEIGIIISNTPDAIFTVDIFKDVKRGFEQLYFKEGIKSLNFAVDMGTKFMDKYLQSNK